ncbi:hypothetical protein RJT34_20083 [Clitoria ternatea]|uniref:Uncharacterized protein n=1 Tax=Clitoria ternatea TaxID=43366 RepID=A0AAN9ISI4_CLITE
MTLKAESFSPIFIFWDQKKVEIATAHPWGMITRLFDIVPNYINIIHASLPRHLAASLSCKTLLAPLHFLTLNPGYQPWPRAIAGFGCDVILREDENFVLSVGLDDSNEEEHSNKACPLGCLHNKGLQY